MKRILTLSILCAAPFFAEAQSVSPSRRADVATSTSESLYRQTKPKLNQDLLENTQQAPELFPGELEDVGPQYLVMDKAQRHRWVQFYADTQLFYTSNALLTEKGNQDTSLMVTMLEASINLPPFALGTGQAAFRAGYREQIWLYSLDDTSNQLNNLDFDVATVFLGFQHNINENWTAFFELDYNRYLSHDNDYNEFYVELMPTWTIQRTFKFADESYITAAYSGAFHWTQTDPDPVSDINNRLDTIVSLSYNRELVSRLYSQLFYRAQWSHYTTNSDRNDFYNTFGLGFVYAFSEWGAIKASINYENRNSTDDLVADYGKWDTGGGLSIVLQF